MAIVDQWMPIIDLNFEILMGGTGDPPVPDGHWPDGTGRTLMSKTGAQNNLTAFPVSSGGSPLCTGRWPVLPNGTADATSEFGLKGRNKQVSSPKANWELASGSAPAIFARMSDAAAPAQTPSKAAIFLRRLITSVILWTVILAALFSGSRGFGRRVSPHHRLSRAGRTGGILRPRRKARPRLLQMVRPARRRVAHGGDIHGTHRQNRHAGFAGARERF